MISKYLLINTAEVREREIEHDLKKHPNIVDIKASIVEETAMADPIFENYNVIAKIEAESNEEIIDIVENELSKLPGIESIQIFSKPKVE